MILNKTKTSRENNSRENNSKGNSRKNKWKINSLKKTVKIKKTTWIRCKKMKCWKNRMRRICKIK